jgi:hypothetical protein
MIRVLTGNSGGIGTSMLNPAAGLVAAGCGEVRFRPDCPDAVLWTVKCRDSTYKNIKIKGFYLFY